MRMSDIAFWTTEYTREVDQLTTTLTALQSLADSNSTNNRKIIQSISECDFKITKIKDVKKSFGLELKLIKDRQEKYEYDIKMKALDERVMIMTKDLRLIKNKQNKQELFQESTGRNQYSTEGKGNDELLDGANRIQDLTLDALGRTAAMINASKEVGTATIEGSITLVFSAVYYCCSFLLLFITAFVLFMSVVFVLFVVMSADGHHKKLTL